MARSSPRTSRRAGRGRQGRVWTAPPRSAVLMSLVMRDRGRDPASRRGRRDLRRPTRGVCDQVAERCLDRPPQAGRHPGRRAAAAAAGRWSAWASTSPQRSFRRDSGSRLRRCAWPVSTPTPTPSLTQFSSRWTAGSARRRPPYWRPGASAMLSARRGFAGPAGEGTAAGIDDSGALLVDTEEGRITLEAGEIHLLARRFYATLCVRTTQKAQIRYSGPRDRARMVFELWTGTSFRFAAFVATACLTIACCYVRADLAAAQSDSPPPAAEEPPQGDPPPATPTEAAAPPAGSTPSQEAGSGGASAPGEVAPVQEWVQPESPTDPSPTGTGSSATGTGSTPAATESAPGGAPGSSGSQGGAATAPTQRIDETATGVLRPRRRRDSYFRFVDIRRQSLGRASSRVTRRGRGRAAVTPSKPAAAAEAATTPTDQPGGGLERLISDVRQELRSARGQIDDLQRRHRRRRAATTRIA